MADQLKLNVPGKADYVGTVRLAVAHVASRAGFDIEAIEDIKVSVSEACTNIICHSQEEGEFAYEVVLDLEESGLTITVTDRGVGFGLEKYVAPSPDEPRERGLGLFIIRTLMDEVDIQSEIGTGTNVRMTKYLQGKTA